MILEFVCPECAYTMNLPTDTIQGEVIHCPDCNADWIFQYVNMSRETYHFVEAEIVGDGWGE
jgi:hypothetical protein